MTNIKMKEDELVCAKVFLDYLAKNYEGKYTARTNSAEDTCDPDVDVYAESDSSGDILKLQVKMIDRECMPNSVFRGKYPNQVFVRDRDEVPWIRRELERCNKHYSDDVKKDMVLLLWTEYGGEMNVEYAGKLFSEYYQLYFKGIYFIDMESRCVIDIKRLEI